MTKHTAEAQRVRGYDALASTPKIMRAKSHNETLYREWTIAANVRSQFKALEHTKRIQAGAARNHMSVQAYTPLYWAWYRKNGSK